MLPSATQIAAAVGCTATLAKTWEGAIREACRIYEIDNPQRLAAFLATIGHESIGLTRQSENLNYRADRLMEVWPSRFSPALAKALAHKPADIANHVYANRMGNGAELSGDGWKYRGRGPIGTTGKANYEAFTENLLARTNSSPDFTLHPELLETPQYGALAAADFWHDHDLNELADRGEFLKLSLRVNGAGANGLPNGWADRKARYAKALRVFST